MAEKLPGFEGSEPSPDDHDQSESVTLEEVMETIRELQRMGGGSPDEKQSREQAAELLEDVAAELRRRRKNRDS